MICLEKDTLMESLMVASYDAYMWYALNDIDFGFR